MKFDFYGVEVCAPFGFEWGNCGFGDSIETERSIMRKFRQVLCTFYFFAPTLQVEAFFDRVDLGVVNIEGEWAIECVVVGETKWGFATDFLIKC